MDERSLMGVFAHPDDEAAGFSGSLLKYGSEGARTAVVCATRGEAGQISDPALATPETLGEVREQELRTAMRLVGVEDVTFLDYRDGTLAEADDTEVTGRIVRHIRRVRPQVIVTFDANGGYGHRDHMAVHRLTIEAFHQAGDGQCYPEHQAEGLEPYAPQKLYAMAFPRSVMTEMMRQLQSQGQDLRPGGDAATIPLDQMGTPDDQITTAISLTEDQIDKKLQVTMAHRTQMSPDSPFEGDRPPAFLDWISTERFVRLYPPGAPNRMENDLFCRRQIYELK